MTSLIPPLMHAPTVHIGQGSYNVIERLIHLKILEPFGDSNYAQKYIYADYYALFDEGFAKMRSAK